MGGGRGKTDNDDKENVDGGGGVGDKNCFGGSFFNPE